MTLQVHCVESGAQPTSEVGSSGKSQCELWVSFYTFLSLLDCVICEYLLYFLSVLDV